jgi:hypothetical protein
MESFTPTCCSFSVGAHIQVLYHRSPSPSTQVLPFYAPPRPYGEPLFGAQFRLRPFHRHPPRGFLVIPATRADSADARARYPEPDPGPRFPHPISIPSGQGRQCWQYWTKTTRAACIQGLYRARANCSTDSSAIKNDGHRQQADSTSSILKLLPSRRATSQGWPARTGGRSSSTVEAWAKLDKNINT